MLFKIAFSVIVKYLQNRKRYGKIVELETILHSVANIQSVIGNATAIRGTFPFINKIAFPFHYSRQTYCILEAQKGHGGLYGVETKQHVIKLMFMQLKRQRQPGAEF